MRRYWLGIGFGVLLIFAIGMTAAAGVRTGKEKVRTLLAKAGGRIPEELTDLPFRLDGRTIGDLSAVHVRRGGADEMGDVSVTVALRDPADASALAGCVLAADDFDHYKRGAGFRCLDASELVDGGWERLGEITFEPGGLRRPLYLSRGDARRWRRSDIRQLEANLVRDGSGGVRAEGVFDLMGNHGDRQRGSFDLTAGEGGARFFVKDARGRELVHFDAGEGGLTLRVNDRNGRRLVRLLAESAGNTLRLEAK